VRASPARRAAAAVHGRDAKAFGRGDAAISSLTWSASSRVGTRTSAAGERRRRRALDDRQREGKRLARPRRRLREDVRPRERVREDERLDPERTGDDARGEDLVDLGAHAERAKDCCDTFYSFCLARDRPLEAAKGGTEKLNLTGRPQCRAVLTR
jgi:hypothetical protein